MSAMDWAACVAALWLASGLAVAALWFSERRATARGLAAAQDEAIALANGGSRARHPSAAAELYTWHCPWCDDRVHTTTWTGMWEGASEHLALCGFYRASGSWGDGVAA